MATMGERPLRLCLDIRRNQLPDTKIVYTFVIDDDTTVSKLLEQVNEVVPLESTTWGLDDYVVELKTPRGTTYECLHFHPISKLLEKDEEILIRPLSSEELKKQRIGGRQQISSDGKHLLDGVAFGRPLLKRPARRPFVNIPPRKRRRVEGIDGQPNSLLDQVIDGELDTTIPSGIAKPFQLVRYVSACGHDESRDDDDDEDDDGDYKDDGDGDAGESTSDSSDADSDEDSDADSDSSDGESRENDTVGEIDSEKLAALERDLGRDTNRSQEPRVRFGVLPGESASSSEKHRSPKSGDSNTDPTDNKGSGVSNSGGKQKTKKRNARRRAKRAMERAKAQQASEATENTISPTVPDEAHAAPQPGPETTPRSNQRLLNLDLSAGRRLLFSALGFRSSSAKRGEPETQEQPSDKGLPVPNGCNGDSASPGASDESQQIDENHPKHWKNRIHYTACECWDYDVYLSPPPFPFVQHWSSSSQQQGNPKRGSKRKQPDSSNSEQPAQSKKRAAAKPEQVDTSSDDSSEGSSDDSSDSNFEVNADSEEDTTDDNSEEGESALDGKGEVDAATADDDLPTLPTDVSSLPQLSAGEAVAGMVITWKSWALSEKTNWQPQILNVTASVLGTKDDGAQLQVRLAQRDREFAKTEKSYDEETGERVYGKFEVPDAEEDDEEEAEDTGEREVLFSELIDPKIVQQNSLDER